MRAGVVGVRLARRIEKFFLPPFFRQFLTVQPSLRWLGGAWKQGFVPLMHPFVLRFLMIPVAVTVFFDTSYATDFGDDTGTYANDSQCDDRRFVGTGMAASLNDAHIGHDRNDCKRLFDAGMIALVDAETGKEVTQCAVIDFGDNSSEWSNDGECDDARFDGPGTHSIISLADVRADANDCKRMCESGRIWLRSAVE